MATSAADQSAIAQLTFATLELNRYIPIPLLVLGTIGNILNVMVFTRPSFKANPCSIYFISSSIVNFCALYVGLVTPFLGLFNLDPTTSSNILCKIRFYLRYTTIALSSWFILLACIDRFLSSCTRATIRAWSSLRIARRVVILAAMIGFIFPFTQTFYCYSIINNACTQRDNTCKLLNDIILLVCHSGIPPVLMVLFGMLTIQNVKRANRTGGVRQRRDIQLIRILLVQVTILVFLFATPVTVQKLYSDITIYTVKSPVRRAIENLINQISIEISYINSSTAFYIYSLTSKKFRDEVVRILSPLINYCFCKRNIVQPIEASVNLNATQTITMTTKRVPTHIA